MTGQNGEAREQIARAIAGKYWERALGDADAVLATPAVTEAFAAAERVRALHHPLDRGTGPQCQGCATHVTFTPWPCATIRALDGQT